MDWQQILACAVGIIMLIKIISLSSKNSQLINESKNSKREISRIESDNKIKTAVDKQTIARQQQQINELNETVQTYKTEEKKNRYLQYLYPELENVFDGNEIANTLPELPDSYVNRNKNVFRAVSILDSRKETANEIIALENQINFYESTKSNLTAIPYMASIMADYETYGIERLIRSLDWGSNVERQKKVKSLTEIRRDAREMVERNKEAQYQLEYLLNLFPNLRDVVETDYAQLPVIDVEDLKEYDRARDYLSAEEYASLSITERNQRALDNYWKSHRRSKWQIGRDYELYIAEQYEDRGCDVDRFGSYMGLEDLGRDLIVKKPDGDTLIVQCKYWSSIKQIHENHINQLYGTVACYCVENNIDPSRVKGVLITNIELSPMAKRMAEYLGILYMENKEMGEYRCIKCNIGKDEFGNPTKIYHLPFDQQYDSTKINKRDEFMARTVAEAEAKGFRRALKWFGSN